jgi:hypothetical protein
VLIKKACDCYYTKFQLFPVIFGLDKNVGQNFLNDLHICSV